MARKPTPCGQRIQPLIIIITVIKEEHPGKDDMERYSYVHIWSPRRPPRAYPLRGQKPARAREIVGQANPRSTPI